MPMCLRYVDLPIYTRSPPLPARPPRFPSHSMRRESPGCRVAARAPPCVQSDNHQRLGEGGSGREETNNEMYTTG